MTPTPQRKTSLIGNLIRGSLIGIVETIPGISGGTVALVVGIYQQLIDSASALIHSVLSLVRGQRDEARAYWDNISWRLLIPLAIGMVIAVFTRSEELTSELQSRGHLVCRLLLEKKKQCTTRFDPITVLIHDRAGPSRIC